MTGFIYDPKYGPCFLVDNSSLEPITTCPRKALFGLVKHKRRDIDAPALRFGAHIHAALAHRYITQYNDPMKSLPEVEAEQLRLLETLFTSNPCENEDWRNLQMAMTVIQHYNETYETEPFTINTLNSTPFVEKTFMVDTKTTIGGFRVFYIGRIDTNVLSGSHQWIMDHKTSSMVGESFWADQAVSEQQRGYCWAVRETTGTAPTGYIINVLACRKPTKSGAAIEFLRREFPTIEPVSTLDDWFQNMLLQVETFLWHHNRNLWPAHHKHCIHKYGTCEFYPICSGPPSLFDDALNSSLYRDNEWSPLTPKANEPTNATNPTT